MDSDSMSSLDWVAPIAAYLNLGGDALRAAGPVLADIGSGVQAAIEERIGRHLEVRDHTDVLNGNGKRTLFLPWDPVVSITSLTVNGATIVVDDPSVGTYPRSSVILRDRNSLVHTNGGVFPEGFGNVVVVYRAGYELPPPALVTAGVLWGAQIFRNRDRVGIASVSTAGQTTSFSNDIPPHIAKMIAPHIRWGKP